jgi:hypothetical protein
MIDKEWVRKAAIGGGLAALLGLAGCASQLGDRGGQEGARPDNVLDVDYVVVYRNANRFPNLAIVCADGLGFATTSTPSGENGSIGGAPLVRLPERDPLCAAKAPKG